MRQASLPMLMLVTVLVVLVVAPAPAAGGGEPLGPGDFEHFVVAEEFTATWCQYCPAAAEQLADIYYNDGYEFYFVAMITDVNDKASDRMGDYPTATGYPTVEFDGGYRETSGRQDDKSQYEQDIEDCGARSDTPISLEINMSYLGDSEIYVKVRIRWDEDGTIVNPTMQVHLRVYITEIVSRYDNHDGDPYHFGFLDYAFDQAIDLDPHEWWTGTTTWKGSEHNDSNGDDFGDIDYDNIALIAAVFNDESSDADKYNLMCSGAIAPSLNVTSPADNSTQTGDFTLEVEAKASYEEGDPGEISSVRYSMDGGPWMDLSEGTGGRWTGTADTSGLDNGWHEILVRATDDRNTTNERTLRFNLSAADNDPPEITIVGPEDGSVVDGDVAIGADVEDASAIANVTYRVDDGPWVALDHASDDRYTGTWDSTGALDGDHTLTVRAEDEHGNAASTSVDVTVDNLQIAIASPADGAEVGNIVDVVVNVTHHVEIDGANLRVDGGNWTSMNVDSDRCKAEWNSRSVDNGWHTLEVRVLDTTGNEESATIDVLVNNTEDDTDPPSILVVAPSEGENLTGMYTLQVRSSDENGIDRVEFSVDGGGWTRMDHGDGDKYTHDLNTRDLDNGDHRLNFRSLDSSGNPATAGVNVTVYNEEDTEPPMLSAIAPADGDLIALGENLTVVVHAADDTGVDSVECALEDGPWRAMSYDDGRSDEEGQAIYVLTYTRKHSEFHSLSDGDHTLRLRASDGAGNGANLTLVFTTDNTPPMLAVDQPSCAGGMIGCAYAIDDSSDIERLDYGVGDDLAGTLVDPGSAGTLTVDLGGLDDGPTYLWVRAVDAAGNEGTYNGTLIVDNTPPVIQPVSPEDDASLSGDLILQVSLEEDNPDRVTWSLDGGDVQSLSRDEDIYLAPINTRAHPDGNHTLLVEATDRAGHRSVLTLDVRFDNTPPTLIDLTRTPATPGVNETISFIATLEDPSGVEGVALWYEICQGETCLLAREVAMSPAWDDHTAEISFDRNGTVTFRIIATDGLGNEGVLHEGQFEVVVPPPADGGGDENGSGEPPEVEIPTSVLLTTITDGQEVSGRILLEGGAFDSPTIMVSIDGGEWNVVATHERRLSGRMPPFTLIDVDNGTFTLDDLLGRPVILDLMAISCSACEDLGAALATITEMYGDGVAVISVSVDPSDTANALRAYRDGHGHDWIYALDTAGLADDLGVEEIPHIVFLTADGHVSGEFTGAMTADEISVQIGLALSERVWSLTLDTTVLENGYHAITVRTEDGRTETFSIHVTNVGAASDGGDRGSDGDMTLLLAGLMVAVIAVAGVAAARGRGRRAVAVEPIEAGVIVAEVLPAGPVRPCPHCGGALTHITDYDAWYCYQCRKYPDLEP